MPSSSVVPGKLWGALVDLSVTAVSHDTKMSHFSTVYMTWQAAAATSAASAPKSTSAARAPTARDGVEARLDQAVEAGGRSSALRVPRDVGLRPRRHRSRRRLRGAGRTRCARCARFARCARCGARRLDRWFADWVRDQTIHSTRTVVVVGGRFLASHPSFLLPLTQAGTNNVREG